MVIVPETPPEHPHYSYYPFSTPPPLISTIIGPLTAVVVVIMMSNFSIHGSAGSNTPPTSRTNSCIMVRGSPLLKSSRVLLHD